MAGFLVLQIALSFIVGGLYIAGAATVSEHLGSKIGGMTAGLPSILLVGLVFIGWVQGAGAVTRAVTITPATGSASLVFVSLFIALQSRGLGVAFPTAIAAWFAIAIPLAMSGLRNIAVALAIAAGIVPLCFLYLRRAPHLKVLTPTFSRRAFACRSLFAGSLVAAAVLASKLFGPLWGGMLATFPASFSSTLVILHRAQGLDFTAAVARTMPIGFLSVLAFAVSVYVLVPAAGVALGIGGAYAVSLVFSLLLYHLTLA